MYGRYINDSKYGKLAGYCIFMDRDYRLPHRLEHLCNFTDILLLGFFAGVGIHRTQEAIYQPRFCTLVELSAFCGSRTFLCLKKISCLISGLFFSLWFLVLSKAHTILTPCFSSLV